MENEKPTLPNDTPSNKSKDSGFDIESLDPDKRSWHYDGDGTKRKKE
jgi:hypothetical protein